MNEALSIEKDLPPMTMPLEYKNEYPNVYLRATVSNDGLRISMVFPADFINMSVAFIADQWGRHRILLSPEYNVHKIIGFVDSAGVKHGKVEFDAFILALQNLIPGKSGSWSAKQREHDLLLGKLFTDLCRPATIKPPPIVEKIIERPMSIESALAFVNRWAVDNRAELIVEDGTLYAEVRKRLGAPPPTERE